MRQVIATPDDPRLGPFVAVRDPALLRRRGLFVAESREVVRLLITASPFEVESVLLTETAAAALAEALALLPAATPVYVAPRALLAELVGFSVHRGALALGRRRAPPPLGRLLERTGPEARVLLIDQVTDPDNVGSLFRSGLALGAELVALGPGCADPLYRKAIRTSIASTLRLPWTELDDWSAAAETLRQQGYLLVALTPAGEVEVAEVPARGRRLALWLGNEGAGLPAERLALADLTARIAMRPGVDSLNVAVAGAVALHAWRVELTAEP